MRTIGQVCQFPLTLDPKSALELIIEQCEQDGPFALSAVKMLAEAGLTYIGDRFDDNAIEIARLCNEQAKLEESLQC